MIEMHETALVLIGKMVNYENLARLGLSILSPIDLPRPELVAIFQGIRKVIEAARPYVPSEIAKHLDPLQAVTMVAAMEAGIDARGSSEANFIAEASLLSEARSQQHIREAAARLAEAVEITEDTVQGVIEELRATSNRGHGPEPEPLSEAIVRVSRGDLPPAVETGFHGLDAVVRMAPNTLTVAAARPGAGKTAFLVGIGLEAAARGWAPLLVSLEMSADELARRHYRHLAPGAAERLQTLQLDRATAGNIARHARRFVSRWGPFSLILVDYLQLVRPDRPRDGRWQEVGDVVRDMKDLALGLHVPVICAAQLSRAVEQRAGKRPELSDLRESGEIEQAADIVLLIHRQDNDAELIIAKNRHGARGLVALTFADEPGHVRFIPRRHLEP